MSNPFFLTRQSANLMEDFARELEAGPSLFLLYGDPRVGKTRLLQELKQSRLAERRVFWIDLSGNEQGEAKVDRSDKVEHLFAAAQVGDIVIADHFESALKKTRHQLFLSWSTDGVDKQINLIVASNSEGFNELRQLAQQYQVRLQSFQLMPLNTEEVDAFLGFYLFPEHPIGKLSMPAPLRKQIAASNGVIGEIIDIAGHDGAQIDTSPPTDPDSIRQGSRVLLSTLVLFAVAIGIGWYYFSKPEPIPSQVSFEGLIPESEAVDEAAAMAAAEIEVQSEPPPDGPLPETMIAVNEADVTTAIELGSNDAAAGVESNPEASVIPADGGAPIDPHEAVLAVDSTTGVSVAGEIDTAAEPEVPAAADAPVAIAKSDTAPQATVEPSDSVPATATQRLLRELQRSLDWIYDRDETVGTVQILLLSYDGFDAASYFDYVAQLESKQVDITRLRIYKSYTGGKVVYSVVYGEYDSRAAASLAIADLPRVLRDAGPIPRSVGGIWEEIRRLDAQN